MLTHEEKIQWMAMWCARNHVQLELEGECGLGRLCVGILTEGKYPDYDRNDVWTPVNAYHKYDCVAVLGRGEEAEDQLYDWLKWFDDHGYTVKSEMVEDISTMDIIQIMIGQHMNVRMVKRA